MNMKRALVRAGSVRRRDASESAGKRRIAGQNGETFFHTSYKLVFANLTHRSQQLVPFCKSSLPSGEKWANSPCAALSPSVSNGGKHRLLLMLTHGLGVLNTCASFNVLQICRFP
jgi:hypothetical protein